MRCLLGIDLGTTGLKAVVFDLSGRPLGRGFAVNQYLPGMPGWAEQDPRAWWQGCCQAVQEMLGAFGVDPADIAGVGVCGFHHCPVFLNAKGEPTRPSLVTHDSRLAESLQELRQSEILEQVADISGSQVTIGHFPPIYHYVLRHDQQALENTQWIVLAKDYLRYKLTGVIGTEVCDATGTNLIAMPGQEWSDSLCALLKVPREKLPEIRKSSEVCGEVTQEAAQASGLKAGTPVVYGGGDSHCALVGLGVIGSGEAGLLLGTNSTLRASFRGFVKFPRRAVWAQQHVVPGRYTVSASSMAGSSALSWFKDVCFGDRADRDDAELYRELETLAESVRPGCDGLLFHPYLYGERSPFYNPNARGAFLSISHLHGKGHFVRGVMEGITFAIANCFDTIKAIAHDREETLATIRAGEGGGSRLSTWRQIIADVLEQPLELVSVEEPGCLGAAILAGVGVGEYKDIPSAVSQTLHIGQVTSPDLKNSDVYKDRRAVFNETYRILEPILYQND
jgi:xylulokinase